MKLILLISAFSVAPFFDQVAIHLKTPLGPGKIYTVSTQNIVDCSGNEIGLNNTCKTGLPEKAKPGDIIFNEILFNPPPYGYDYLELFNRSSGIIRCSELFLAGKNTDGSLKDPVSIIKNERNFFPGEYLLLTENPDWVLQNYPMAVKSQMLTLTTMPSLPDDQGKVVLLNQSGESLDELDYDHHWHSPLLAVKLAWRWKESDRICRQISRPTGHPLRRPQDMGRQVIRIQNLIQIAGTIIRFIRRTESIFTGSRWLPGFLFYSLPFTCCRLYGQHFDL